MLFLLNFGDETVSRMDSLSAQPLVGRAGSDAEDGVLGLGCERKRQKLPWELGCDRSDVPSGFTLRSIHQAKNTPCDGYAGGAVLMNLHGVLSEQLSREIGL